MNEQIDKIFAKIGKSKTEEEVISHLKDLIKRNHVESYRDRLLSNPYFKSLLSDIKVEIISELNLIRESIKEELIEIEIELKKPNSLSETLLELKKDCISLLYDVDEKEKSIKEL